ncbi:MAG: membrane dipeptidase [Bacteroidetes bacterium]|nr:MAG: membrane dipeptidase [Bacteroidota bacterium]
MRTFILLLATAMLLTGCADSETQLEKKAARIHAAAYTVDSHTDTPLRLNRQGFDFGVRNDPQESRSKIDLPRMKEGGMDGIWFAVFIGQGERTPEGNQKAMEEALEITQEIYNTVEKYSDDLEVATKADDLARIAKKGKHAIYLGLENGYPIGRNPAKLDMYYSKGIRYVTLVHTRNNDICDSSTDSLEHKGLSPLGEEVVTRMNDLGMLIDVSHASDKSFYDVIQTSRAPIIASHSCARAMCDNPRNLSDEMLLKLKENGGVIQMCILSAYVKTPVPNPERDSARAAVREKHGNYYELDEAAREAFIVDWYAVDRDFPREMATVSDAVDHIDHIVDLIGIDYVGIGTDFDGGGGLADCFDVSEMGNITLELVRRGYSASEIKKIWGGNLTRVFKEVEATAI